MTLNPTNINRVVFVALLAACCLGGEASVCGQQVEILLKSPTVDCPSQTIRLEHVAQIRNGNSQLRHQIAHLVWSFQIPCKQDEAHRIRLPEESPFLFRECFPLATEYRRGDSHDRKYRDQIDS